MDEEKEKKKEIIKKEKQYISDLAGRNGGLNESSLEMKCRFFLSSFQRIFIILVKIYIIMAVVVRVRVTNDDDNNKNSKDNDDIRKSVYKISGRIMTLIAIMPTEVVLTCHILQSQCLSSSGSHIICYEECSSINSYGA